MKWYSSLLSTWTAIALLVSPSPTSAEFTECLGIEVSQLAAMPSCVMLYEACEAGVAKLNAQLQEAPDKRFHPIEAQYKDGNFYGSNLALAVFDTPQLPSENTADGGDTAMSRSPVGLFAVIASATISIGLLFHHRRRLHNGYAPIVIMKRGQLQGKNAVATPQPTPQRTLSTPGSSKTEESALTRETSERFAV
ncbi:hypothetical protein ATCC90586_001693 [Pythium insidiosum]|nr:hypothetical protein ATCC90586_001693 [Pythium insidiosum]